MKVEELARACADAMARPFGRLVLVLPGYASGIGPGWVKEWVRARGDGARPAA